MRLVKLDHWRKEVFAEDSRPSYQSALRWAKAGKIPGAVHIHGSWHVDMDAYEAALAEQTTAGSGFGTGDLVEKEEPVDPGSALATKLGG